MFKSLHSPLKSSRTDLGRAARRSTMTAADHALIQ